MNWLNRMNTNTSSPIAVPDGKHDDVTVTIEPVGNTEVAHGEYPTNDGTGAIYAPSSWVRSASYAARWFISEVG